MEVDSQRVWDYAGDNYVHRLIQNKVGELGSVYVGLLPEGYGRYTYDGMVGILMMVW